MFNWIVGIPLLTLFASTALAISLMPVTRRESGRIALKALVVLISLWTFSSLMYHTTTIPSTLFWLYMILIFAMLAGAIGIHFCVQYTGIQGTLARFAPPTFYVTIFLLIVATLTGKMVTSAVLLPNGVVNVEYGPFAPLMWGTIAIATLTSLSILLVYYFKSPQNRNRFIILPIIGFIILTLGGFTNLLVSQYPFDILANLIFISLLSYAVVGSHILRPVEYENWWFSGSGIFLMVVICYIGVFTFSFEWLEANAGISHVSAAIVSFILFFTTFRPIRSLITHRVLGYIFPFSHRYYEALSNLTQVDQSLTKWDHIIVSIMSTIVNTTKAKEAILLMRNDMTQHFEAAYVSHNDYAILPSLTLPINHPLIKELGDRASSMTLDETEQRSIITEISDSYGRWQKPLEDSLFCGMHGHDGLVGIIIIIKDSPGGWKRNEDRDFLELACQQITPLIDNYLLYQSVQRELTQRKLVQRALEQSEEKYRTLVEYANDYIFMFDRDLKVLSVNKAAGKFLGGEPETFVGKSVLELFYPEISEPYSHDLEKVLETGFTLVGDSHIKMGDQEVELNTVLSPIKDNEGQVLAIIGVSRDISERKRAEEKEKMLLNQLHIAKRLAIVGEMTAGVAHEVNNPLTAVIVASDWLMGLKLPDEIRKDVEIINKGAQRAADILERMITFTSQRSVQKDYLDIGQILEIAIEFRAHSLSNNSISIIREYSEDLPNTMGNGEQLQEVFLNLIINAEYEMKEAHGEGQLIIRTEVVGDNIKISFIDNGRGIREENIDSLFNPFFTTKEVGKGSGLGLSICYGIITEHGGKIYAESTFGEGATFVIELPIVKSQSNPAV